MLLYVCGDKSSQARAQAGVTHIRNMQINELPITRLLECTFTEPQEVCANPRTSPLCALTESHISLRPSLEAQ